MRWTEIGEMNLGFKVPCVGQEWEVGLLVIKTYQNPKEMVSLLLLEKSAK